jgi:aryl sulfotransferase
MAVSISSLKPYRSAVADNRRWAGFAPRPGDVFVCTPAKCGTTWMQAIVASLLWPDGDTPEPVLRMSPWIEFESDPIDEVLARLAAQRHRRFIKTHTPADGIPFFADAKYVFVARDGRDAFMSMCNHLERFRADVREGLNARAAIDGVTPMPAWDGDVHGFFALWLPMLGLLEHVATFWQLRHAPNVLLVHYNDLKADLAGEMRRVADFLDVSVPAAKWPAVVDRCTFESMRSRGAELGEIERFFEGGVRSFIFKGTNGRWRDVLTADELAAYASRVAEVLPPAAGVWLERGRRAADPRSARD